MCVLCYQDQNEQCNDSYFFTNLKRMSDNTLYMGSTPALSQAISSHRCVQTWRAC